jgi:hypothetical protein
MRPRATPPHRLRIVLGAMTSLLVGAVALVTACGGDDETPAGGAGDAATGDTSPSSTADGEPSADALPPLPSFCQGIVLYASLDTGFVPEIGPPTTLTLGSTTAIVPRGRFGGSVALYDDSGIDDGGGGAALYFLTPDGGAPVFPDAVGTVSLWYRGDAITDVSPSASPVLVRPVQSLPGEPILGSGLALVSLQSRFGLLNTRPTGASEDVLAFQRSRVVPFLREGEFNHFVAAWQKGDASTPTALLALNGGLGTLFDAGPDAQTYADAQPTDAGDLLVPYRGYTSKQWDNDASTRAFRLGGTGTSASQGEIDDVALWNRVLSFEEIAAIYEVSLPIWQACRLR